MKKYWTLLMDCEGRKVHILGTSYSNSKSDYAGKSNYFLLDHLLYDIALSSLWSDIVD